MRSLTEHTGYLTIDHRDSPGMPDEVMAKIGLPVKSGVGFFEGDVKTCAHCQAIVFLNPDRTRPRNYCAKCDHYVCDKPTCIVECTPVLQQFEREYEKALQALTPDFHPAILITG